MKTSDGSASAYAELPVPVAHLKWTRGNSQLRSIAKEDPAAFLGGWRCSVLNKDGENLPSVPLPIVERTSEDGKHLYKVYSSNVISFIPLRHRTRFERREKVKDETTGREYEKCVAVSRERLEGYAPNRQVFGLVVSKKDDTYAPAVLHVDKWSAFITFEKSGQAWSKIDKVTPEDQVLVRRYGTLGAKKDEVVMPNFEEYGQSRSTPIEAVGLSQPRYLKVTPEIEKLLADSEAWANCERWLAIGKVVEEPVVTVSEKEFHARCVEMGLSNIEEAQLLKENGGDAVKALASLDGDAINEALAQTEQDDNPY